MRKNVAALTFLFALLAAACQSTMSVEEAKQVSATFADAPVTSPPRTATDIMGILEQQQRDDDHESAFWDLARYQAKVSSPPTFWPARPASSGIAPDQARKRP